MVGKKSAKRSTIYHKGNNATLDQFFTIKNKSTQDNENENEINHKSLSSDNTKQQQVLPAPSSSLKTTLLLDKNGVTSTNIKPKRRPLADIGGKATHSLTLMPTKKPAKPTFAVLRDEDIEQGTTEVDKQQTEQSNLSPSLQNDIQKQITDKDNTTKKQTDSTLNDGDDDKTQDSQISSFDEPVGSPDSFFGDSGTEFRVDILDSNDDSDNDDDHVSSSFFDDDDDDNEAPFLTKTHRRTRLPIVSAATTPSIPSKRALENIHVCVTHNKKVMKSDMEDTKSLPPPLTPLPSSSSSTTANTEEDDDQTTTTVNSSTTLEFSISNSLTIPLDIKDNYHSSSSDDEDDDTDAPPPSVTATTPVTPASQQSSSPQQQQQQQQSSQTSRISELSTLPMSLPSDTSLDLHVAYPVPRGNHVMDKFGL